jgi:hypothetical protein
MNNHQLAAKEAGGTLLEFEFVDLDALRARYAPGCGESFDTIVWGFMPATLPCGASVREPDGSKKRYYCDDCTAKGVA